MLASLLCLVVVGQLLPPPEDPAAALDRLLRGCTRTPSNASGAQYKCGPILASIAAVDMKPTDALAATYQGLVSALDGTTTTSDSAVTYGNKTGPLRRFEVRKQGSKDVSFVGRLAALEVGKGASWVVSCGYFASHRQSQ